MIGETRRTPSMKVTWLDEEREPQHPPNPAYPNSVDVDCSGSAKKTCTQPLPYPAKRCGQYLVVCENSGRTIIITATGPCLQWPRNRASDCMEQNKDNVAQQNQAYFDPHEHIVSLREKDLLIEVGPIGYILRAWN